MCTQKHSYYNSKERERRESENVKVHIHVTKVFEKTLSIKCEEII